MNLKLLISIICIGYFINSAGTTIPAPFFGVVFELRGFNESIIGYIFSAFYLGNLIATIILGYYTETCKKKLMIIGSIIYMIA